MPIKDKEKNKSNIMKKIKKEYKKRKDKDGRMG